MSEPDAKGLRYIALRVDDCEKMSKQFDYVPTNFDWFGKRYCYMSDPDGLSIEYHE